MGIDAAAAPQTEHRRRWIMNDSRCRNDVTSVDGDGGRASGGHDRAGPLARGRGGVWGRTAAVLAGLALMVLDGSGLAQEPGAPAPRGPAAGLAEPLSLRYRFSERYGVAEDPVHPELLVQYQVGVIETIRSETEKAQGAPDRTGYTYRLIYTERPAKTSRNGDV